MKDTAPVGTYPASASPYGLLDMVGNVWEWTCSLGGRNVREPLFGYPYDPSDGREDPDTPTDMRRILRDVSFLNDRSVARCASRYRYSPGNFFPSVGFRVALAPASKSVSPPTRVGSNGFCSTPLPDD